MSASQSKPRKKRQPGVETVPMFTRISPEAKDMITRGARALGVVDSQFLEEILRRAACETDEGLPAWAVERMNVAEQLELSA